MQPAELDDGTFDEVFDVVVAGYGFGGGITAIEAARGGASVLICEKMPQPGGVSICSGGGVRCALDAEDAFAYLKATNAGTTPDDVVRVLADGMATAEAYVKDLAAAVDGTSVKSTEFSGRQAAIILSPAGRRSSRRRSRCRRLSIVKSFFPAS